MPTSPGGKKQEQADRGLKSLLWKRENSWNRVGAAERQRIDAYCRGYMDFLSRGKTEREAYALAAAAATAAGYKTLEALPKSALPLKPGAKVMRGWGGRTLLLARLGRRPLEDGMRIVGAHIDAPRLDCKPNPLYEEGGMALLDTHYYGGIKKYQWVAMPLALHGVIVRQDGSKAEVCIGEDPADPVFVITDLLPHLGQDQAKKTMSEAVTGEALNVLAGSVPVAEKDGDKARVKLALLRLLHDKYGCSEEDLASADLEIVPAGPARELGFDRSMILGYGHDDRVCAHAALRALLELDATPEHTAVAILCDKEEIGSAGATGMQSAFFENSIAELLALTGAGNSGGLALRRALERSRMISADVNALHDPNYPEVSSPNGNMAVLNGGVTIAKYGGSRGKSGSSEASAEFMAECRRIFNAAGVIWQTGEHGKVDQGGGGTIAQYLARYGMDVVDCGPGLLSMHAPWEVVGKLDAYETWKAYHAFLRDFGSVRGKAAK